MKVRTEGFDQQSLKGFFHQVLKSSAKFIDPLIHNLEKLSVEPSSQVEFPAFGLNLIDQLFDGDFEPVEGVIPYGDGRKDLGDSVLALGYIFEAGYFHHFPESLVVGTDEGDHFEHAEVFFAEGEGRHYLFYLFSHLLVNHFDFEVILIHLPVLYLVVLQKLFVVRHQIDGVLHIEVCVHQKDVPLPLHPVYLTDNTK